MAEQTDSPPQQTNPSNQKKIRYLTSVETKEMKRELLEDYKFSSTQIAQLAGLSIASAVARIYPPIAFKDVLVICGSGMIGSYGLVTAVHLKQFGYNVSVHYAKHTQDQYYLDFLIMCKKVGVILTKQLPPTEKLMHHYKVMVDGLHDNEYLPILERMLNAEIPICSIDVPSGWDLETGPKSDESLKPSMLISIGAPKMCAQPKIWQGAYHFLGGRFISPAMKEKFQLVIPNYPGDDQIVDMNCFGPCCRK